MKSHISFLVLLSLLLVFSLSQPSTAQEKTPVRPPDTVVGRIFFDPAPDQEWAPYELLTGEQTAVFAPNAPMTTASKAGQSGYVQMDTLIVIYPHTAAGSLSASQVQETQEQVKRARDFYWRSSHFKLYLDLTFLVIEEHVDASEFKSAWTCGWLWPNDHYDGDGESPDADLAARGIKAGDYDSINLLWAHNGGTISKCAGGLTWPNGWSWSTAGETMITTNALSTLGETVWNPFHHEFQHSIDGAFALNGVDAYFHADYPWAEPLRFGDNWHFHAVQMRHWPVDDWFSIIGRWGAFREVPDADEDGLPDSGPLPLTEELFGSSPALVDSDGDGLTDLQEAMAGMFRGADPLHGNSDADGWPDAEDETPLYPLDGGIVRKLQDLNGEPGGWTLLTDHLAHEQGDFEAAVYANWHQDFVYLMITTNQSAEVMIEMDALNDGFWHGRDNYQIHLRPLSDPLAWAAVQDCSARQTDLERRCRFDDEGKYAFARLIDPAQIGREYGLQDGKHVFQLAIPSSTETGLSPRFGREIGLAFSYENIDHVWGHRAWTFEENDLVSLPLITSDAMAATGQIVGQYLCDEPATPLAASITFAGSKGQSYATESSEAGEYDIWLRTSENPYTMTVTREGFQTAVFENMIVPVGEPLRQDALLHRIAPCVRFEPHDPTVTVRAGTVITAPLTVRNRGLQASPFYLEYGYYGSGYTDWLTLSLEEGRLEPGASATATMHFDAASAGAAPGVYRVWLTLHTTSVTEEDTLELNMHIVDYGLVVTPLESRAGGPAGSALTHTVQIHNTGTTTDTFDIALQSAWPAVLSADSLTLVAGESQDLALAVTIPPGAAPQSEDTAVLTITSRAAADVMQKAKRTTRVEHGWTYLPAISSP